MIIRMTDIRAAKMCSRGARAFFQTHGLNWEKFLQEGIPEEELLNTGDPMARQVVETAHRNLEAADGRK